MPATLIPNNEIPELAQKVTSPAMLKALRRLEVRDFIHNGAEVDAEMATALKQLAGLGLVDPGYAGSTGGEPFIWVGNGNGRRVLKHLAAVRRYRYRLNSRAHTALQALTENDRETVMAAVESLLQKDQGDWPRENVLDIGANGSVFLLSASPDLRVFIRIVDSDTAEISDIVREETLQLFREAERPVGRGR